MNVRAIRPWPSSRLVVLAALLLAACQSSADPTADESPPAAVGSTPTAWAEPSSSPSPTAPTATPQPSAPSPSAPIRPDAVVATTVEFLSLRRSPGTSGELLGTLSLDTLGFVVAGPTEVGGVRWYLLSGMGLPYGSGCVTGPPTEPIFCPSFQGWVAGANGAGDPWLEPANGPECPDPPLSLETISESGYTLRLICWADEDLTFRAYWPTIPAGAGLGGICQEEDLPAGFLLCQNINYNGLAANETEGFTQRLTLSIDPDSGVTMPERGQWIEVTGHFDDPAASLCADAPTLEESPESLVFRCRLQFVPTSVTPSP